MFFATEFAIPPSAFKTMCVACCELKIRNGDIKLFDRYSPDSSAGLYNERTSETTAAISRMISVTSWRASQTNWRNVFGGFGGIVLEPKVSLRCSKSDWDPLNPAQRMKDERKL